MGTGSERNQPCHCGSGRKYKKCCLPEDIEAERTQAAVKDAWSKAFSLDPEQLRERLTKLGLDISRESFNERAASTLTSSDVAEAWMKEIGREPSLDEKAMIEVGAVELWRQHCPERPCQEMLQDDITDGYVCLEDDRPGDGLELWWSAWQVVAARHEPEMTSIADLEPILSDTDEVRIWLDDLGELLLDQAFEDETAASRGIELCRWLISALPDEEGAFSESVTAELGDLQDLAGDPAASDRTFEDLIAAQPLRALGYVAFADVLERRANLGEGGQDRERALSLLEQAAQSCEDGSDFDLETRLADLRKALERTG